MSLHQTKIELYPRGKLKELTVSELEDLHRRYTVMAALFKSESNVASERTALRRRREVTAELRRQYEEEEVALEELEIEEPVEVPKVPEFCHSIVIILKCITRGQNIKVRKIEITIAALKLNPFDSIDIQKLVDILIDHVLPTDFGAIFMSSEGYQIRTQSERLPLREIDSWTAQQLLSRPDSYIIVEMFLFDHDYGRERYRWVG